MTRTTATRLTATALSAILVLLSPGLPFYAAFAGPIAISLSGSGAATWVGSISRAAAGLQAPGAQDRAPGTGKLGGRLLFLRGVRWRSPAGQRLAQALGAHLASVKKRTPEWFDALKPEEQEAELAEAAARLAPEFGSILAEAGAPSASAVTLSPTAIQTRTERTGKRADTIARALGTPLMNAQITLGRSPEADPAERLKGLRRALAKELIDDLQRSETDRTLWKLERLAQEGAGDATLLRDVFAKSLYQLATGSSGLMMPGQSGRRLVAALERIALRNPDAGVRTLYIDGVMNITRHYGADSFARFAVQSVERIAVNSASRDVRKKAVEELRRRIYRQEVGRSSNVPSRGEIESAIDRILASGGRPLRPGNGVAPAGGTSTVASEGRFGKQLKSIRKAAVAAAPYALAVAPLLAVTQAARVGLESTSALGAVAFAAGALAFKDLAKEFLQRAKTTGKAYGGATTLAMLAGGAIGAAGVAAAMFVGLPPLAAAAALSAVVITGTVAARRHTPPPSTGGLINSGRPGEATLFSIAKTNDHYFLKLRKDQLGKPFLLYAMFDKAPGTQRLYSSWLAGDFLATFEKVGDHVQLLAKNVDYRAPRDSPLQRTFDKALADSPVARAKIVESDNETLVVSLDELFAQDILDLNGAVDEAFGNPYAPDAQAAALDGVKAFPQNIKVTARLGFKGRSEPGAARLPDAAARNLSFTVSYSLLALPQGDYAPRKADDRIGFFNTVFQDWSDGQRRDLTTRYVNRWKLEKKDPGAALSEPKEPIVFWLENTIPVEYREAVRRGVLEWNKAFEKIGFKDAVVVKQQPDPAPESPAAPLSRRVLARAARLLPAVVRPQTQAQEQEYFDPADARFNVIRWFMNSDDFVLAIGPSRANPFTGQLLNAGIAFHAGFTRPGHILEMSGVDDPLDQKQEDPKPHKHSAACRHGLDLARQAAAALNVVEGRGAMTPEQRKQFVEDFITETIVHEVGHTLGLRHNFAASTWLKPEELAGKNPYSASVMDYNPVNLSAPGEEQGPYFQTQIGPYDYKAIEYAYKPLDGMDAQEQAKALEAIAASLTPEGLSYATDEDVTGMDPQAQAWDLGSDPVAFAEKRIAIVRDLWDRLAKKELKDGEGYQRLTKSFIGGIREYLRAVNAAMQNIGGIRFHRDHAGNAASRVPFEPVPVEEQVRALEFLDRYVFQDPMLTVSPELLKKLAPERQPTLSDPYPLLDNLPYNKVVLLIRLIALQHLLSPEVLDRLADSRAMAGKGERTFRAHGLIQAVTNSVWFEVLLEKPQPAKGGPRKLWAISPMRRELQIAFIDRLVFAAYSRDTSGGAAAAQEMLMGLRHILEQSMQDPSWEPETRAHLLQAFQKVVQGTEMGPLLARAALSPHRGDKPQKP